MWSPDLYADALRFAAERHRGQLMKDSELPYLTHVSMVAAEVMGALARERFAQPDLAVQCALLHDTVEDTGTTLDELRAHFGAPVADGVAALTKGPDYFERILAQPPEVWAVKLADRITNLAPPPRSWTREKKVAYRDEAGEILRALAPASLWLADRLAARIARYEMFF